jgi:diguanylate cyclase (GGDEF)-like protein
MTRNYRSNDAVITICQDNHAGSITILDINDTAEEMLTYRRRDVAGKPLHNFVPPRIADMFKDYVKFGRDGNDVGEVLSKVQRFSIVSREGKKMGFRLKVVRAESNGGAVNFHLVLQSAGGQSSDVDLRSYLEVAFKAHERLDPDTALPDRQSLAKDIEVMLDYQPSNRRQMSTCLGVLQIDHYDALFSQYGRRVGSDIVKHVAQLCRQSLRPGDVVGIVNYKRVGVLLLNTTPETSRQACNRLRFQVAAAPFLLRDKVNIGLSVSITFGSIFGRSREHTILEDCDAALNSLPSSAANVLTEVTRSGP